jgi:uncharacterized protein (DUF1800 family)
MQPLAWDDHGVLRFKANRIVRDLLDRATEAKIMDLHTIAVDAQVHGKYTQEERQQFAQLIGYSLSGYSDLRQYVTDRAWDRAQALPVPKKPRKNKGAPDGR